MDGSTAGSGEPRFPHMTRLSLSIPDDLGQWAEARAAEARMAGAGEYIAALLRRERDETERAERLQAAGDGGLASPDADLELGARETERLRAAWAEGLASGNPEPAPADWADQVIARGRARLAAARGGR